MPLGNKPALQVTTEVRKAVVGKDSCIIKAMAALLAGGHILIEDIPGVGKTTMAMAFSKAMSLSQKRVQFTPDVMPSDITGYSVYSKDTGALHYQPGAVMCNLLLADEINRSSPKTQSALLEVMEEGFVTVDGTRRKLPDPFLVIATQNPLGSAGTQPLPPSQIDRFMIQLGMGYPSLEDEIVIAKGGAGQNAEIQRVMSAETLTDLQLESQATFVHDSVYAYIARLVQATRENPHVELGLSPRGTIALTKMAKSIAFLRGRDYVTPEDVWEVWEDTAIHRIFLKPKAKATGTTPRQILDAVLDRVDKPTARRVRA